MASGIAACATGCARLVAPPGDAATPAPSAETPAAMAPLPTTPTGATTQQAGATATAISGNALPRTDPSATAVRNAVPTPPTSTGVNSATTAPATPTPVNQVALDIRLWNGTADVQLDGRSVDPGQHLVDAGATHHVAALVDGQVVATTDAPPDGGAVDLVVPPPLASLAIMIENQADARPQTGLTHADVVYEALAEGGITRFIALYLSANASRVGPVRSLRHYFAFWAAEYGADVVHIGASPEGYAWRNALNMGHLDETYGEPGIWRVGTRPPPHNAYTDTATDRGFLQQRGRQHNYSWGPLLFSETAPLGQLQATDINLSFRPWAYRVDYAWDASRARYLRRMEGSPHLDADTGEQIAPASVVVEFAEVDAIPNDPKYRLDVNLAGGGGQLVVFSSGTRRDGNWIKTDPRSPSVWLDVGGNPIVLPPGPVWVEVLPNGSPLNVS